MHRTVSPGNAWDDWYEGRALHELGQFDHACELFHRASAAFDDEQMRKEAFAHFVRSSRKRGQVAQEIYSDVLAKGVLEPEFFFHLLAGKVEYRETQDGLGELSDLIAIHRQNRPDDPWLYFYLGQFELYKVEEGGDLAAAEYFSQGYRKAVDRDMRDLLRSRAVGHYCVGGKTQYAYRVFGADPDTYRELVLYLTRDGKVEELAWLNEEHKRRNPDDVDLVWAEVRSAWEREDYDEVVKLVSAHEQDLLDNAPDSRWTIQNWWFRSLVRTKQFDAAWELADSIEPQWGDGQQTQYHVIVLAARGQSDRVIKILEQQIRDEHVTPFWIYHDGDLAMLLQDRAYDGFRSKYPREKALDDILAEEDSQASQQQENESREDRIAPIINAEQ
ncbi:MAG: hypothetical protein R3C10_07150 [Pirellulales bacterium]